MVCYNFVSSAKQPGVLMLKTVELGCIAFRDGLNEFWDPNLCLRGQNMHGPMESKFQKTLSFGQLGRDGIGFRVALRADNNHASAKFYFQAADSAIRLGAKRICQPQCTRKKKQGVPQRKLEILQSLVIQTG